MNTLQLKYRASPFRPSSTQFDLVRPGSTKKIKKFDAQNSQSYELYLKNDRLPELRVKSRQPSSFATAATAGWRNSPPVRSNGAKPMLLLNMSGKIYANTSQ
jgi:hypothetical protein